MREMLFRGKRLDNGEWVYGYYVKGADRHCIVMSLAEYPRYDVDPETVGQYTGEKDMNGTKIYECDIYQWGDDKGIIKFRNGQFYIDWYVPFTWGNKNDLYHNSNGTVIGNIHE